MHKPIPIEELNKLIERSRKGDVMAFEIIVRSYQRYGLAVSFRIMCNEDDAKDIVQEGFIRIWKNLGSYNSSSKFTTWMYKIIVNLCYDKLKSERETKWYLKKCLKK